MSRLEEIEANLDRFMAPKSKPVLFREDAEWLINRVEELENEYQVQRVELLEEHIERLEKVNQRYKQALEELAQPIEGSSFADFLRMKTKARQALEGEE